MSEPTCDNLDDYLAGELDDRRRTELETHFQTCPACREELLAQAELARLLRAASGTLEASPADLTARIRHGVAVAASRTRRRVAVAAVMAAVAVGAAGWRLRNALNERAAARPQPEQRIAQQRIAEERQTGADAVGKSRREGEPETANMADASLAAPATAVLVASTSETIAVPIKSENPNVSIFWLYPAVATAQR